MPPITSTGPLALFLDAADRGPWTKAPLDLRASLNELAFTQFSSFAEQFSLFTGCPNLSLNLQPPAPEIGSYAMSERGRCFSTAVILDYDPCLLQRVNELVIQKPLPQKPASEQLGAHPRDCAVLHQAKSHTSGRITFQGAGHSPDTAGFPFLGTKSWHKLLAENSAHRGRVDDFNCFQRNQIEYETYVVSISA